MAGRPPRTEQVKGVSIRIPPALIERVDHCQWLLMSQEGHKMTQNTAYERIIEAGCATLEGTLEGKETPTPGQTPGTELSDISQISISKLSEIASEDYDIPGYGFPEDEEGIPTPQHNGAVQMADTEQGATPAPEASAQPMGEPEQGVSPIPAPQPETPQAPVQTAELPAYIIRIAEVRAEHFRMSERTFAQYLFEHDIYRHRTKDGREVPIPHTTLRKWLQRAQDTGLL